MTASSSGTSPERHHLRGEVFHLLDPIPLSTSSVAPAFSIAAAYGVMVAYAGPQAIMSVVVAFPFFLFAAIVFRQLNIHYPPRRGVLLLGHHGHRTAIRRLPGVDRDPRVFHVPPPPSWSPRGNTPSSSSTSWAG